MPEANPTTSGGQRPAQTPRPEPDERAPRSTFTFHADLGVEQISARFQRQRFAPHAHDDYLFGITTEGAESLIQRGCRQVSSPGNLRLINPGEIHEGGPANDLWAYEAIYVPPGAISALLDLPALGGVLPDFQAAVIQDACAVSELMRTFRLLRTSADAHERETALSLSLARVVARHAKSAGRVPPRCDQHAVAVVKAYLHDRFAEQVALADLSLQAGLSRFHLLRTFKAMTGFTPWQFQAQLRVDAARRLLRAGERASQVAQTCGFVDQSHFTRVFRQAVGVTPGVYASAHATGSHNQA